MDIQSLVQSHVKDLEAYKPPNWEALAARAGIQPDQLIRLDANENPYGLCPRVAEALARFDGYGFYPDYGPLVAALARYAGVEPEKIVLGNGADEVIDMVVRLFVAPGQGVIICPPTFEMYAISTRAYNGRILSLPRHRDFTLDVQGIEALVAGQEANVHPKLLFLISPGNPDGQAIPLETIRRLLRLPLVVAVDEAYIEFGGVSAVSLLDAHPNLIVIRTLSKWAGMAGLRLGYALASAGIAEAMDRLRGVGHA
jgi:histidinol-phosphate aminotransferase